MNELEARLADLGYSEPLPSVELVERLLNDLAELALKQSALLKKHERSLSVLEQRQVQIQRLRRARSPSPLTGGDGRSAAALLAELDALSRELRLEQDRQRELQEQNDGLTQLVHRYEQEQKEAREQEAAAAARNDAEAAAGPTDGRPSDGRPANDEASSLEVARLRAKVQLLESHLRTERGKRATLQASRDELQGQVNLLTEQLGKQQQQQQQQMATGRPRAPPEETSTSACSAVEDSSDRMWLGVFGAGATAADPAALSRKVEELEHALQQEHLLKCELSSSLEVAVQQAQSQRQQLEAQLRRSQDSLKSVAGELADTRSALDKAEAAVLARRDQCLILQGRVELLAKNQVNSSLAEEEEREKLLKELRQTQDALDGQRATATNAEAARREAESRAALLQAAVQQQQTDLKAVEAELSKLRAEHNAAEAALETLKANADVNNFAMLSKNLTELMAERTGLLAKVDALQAKSQELQEERLALLARNEKLQREVEELNGVVVELETAKSTLISQQSRLATEANQLRHSLQHVTAELNATRASAQGITVGLETLEERLHDCHEEQAESAAELQSLKSQLAKSKVKLATTTHRLEQYRKAFQPMQATCDKLRQQLREKNAEESGPAVPRSAPPSMVEIAMLEESNNDTEGSSAFDGGGPSEMDSSLAALSVSSSTLERSSGGISRWITPLPTRPHDNNYLRNRKP